jgi:hypothetical protein
MSSGGTAGRLHCGGCYTPAVTTPTPVTLRGPRSPSVVGLMYPLKGSDPTFTRCRRTKTAPPGSVSVGKIQEEQSRGPVPLMGVGRQSSAPAISAPGASSKTGKQPIDSGSPVRSYTAMIHRSDDSHSPRPRYRQSSQRPVTPCLRDHGAPAFLHRGGGQGRVVTRRVRRGDEAEGGTLPRLGRGTDRGPYGARGFL